MNKIEATYSLLKEIKHQCEEHCHGCTNCNGFIEDTYKCKVKEINYLLCRNPSEWDLDKVREWLDA